MKLLAAGILLIVRNCCLVVVMAVSVYAEGVPSELAEEDPLLGRLFFAPEKRRAMDLLRQSGVVVAAEESGTSGGEEVLDQEKKVVAGPRYVSLAGVVIKENGKHVLVVNGQSIVAQERFDGEGFSLFPNQLDSRGVPVVSQDSQHIFYIKPGQSMDFVGGRVVNTYEINPRELATARREPPVAVGRSGAVGKAVGQVEPGGAGAGREAEGPAEAKTEAKVGDKKVEEGTLSKVATAMQAMKMAADVAKMVNGSLSFAGKEGLAGVQPPQGQKP